jgi:flagellar biosynthetic protein FlhB
MAAEDQDSRTEDPTGKRQAEALNKGNVAISRDVGYAVMLLTAVAVMLLVLPVTMRPLFAMMQNFVQQPERIPLDSPADIGRLIHTVGFTMALGIGPAMLIFMGTGIIGTIAQLGGFLWSTEKLKLNWGMLNPGRGISRIFSSRALIEWAKGLVKLILVALVTFFVLRPEFAHVEVMIGTEPAQTAAMLLNGMRRLLLTALIVIAVVAVADFMYQRWQHWRSLKMTKQEVKDESKNADGDPIIKNQQRARRRQRARQRMLQAVPKASVVITNPTHYAVALQYEQGMNAPKLVAKGVDFLAARIREMAVANDIPIIENPPIARALHAAVEVDQEIPPEHYKAVAEIIGYVMRLKRIKRAS